MKLPRDVSGEKLGKKLKNLGFLITRQTGSHMRLTKVTEKREYHLTIPKHRFLKLGTLNNILKDVAKCLGITKDELINKLWE